MRRFDKTPSIAIVDDEEMVLSSLRAFLQLETSYDVRTFDSPKKALGNLKNGPLDLIVSDYLMPEMNGIEFLLAVKESHPFATRILLTGYADKENAIKAINEVGLYQYIEKPWDNDELKIAIDNGLERRFLMEQLQQKIQEVENVQRSLQEIQTQIIKAFM
jgi:response regulator RpfG family c-di-GMP phosphodiesterase